MSDELKELAREWKQPRELAVAVPREVELAGGGKFMAIMAAIFLLGAIAAGVLLQRGLSSQEHRRDSLRATGVEADGVVTRHWRTGGKEDTPMVAYRFEHEGREYEGSASTPGDIWRALLVGSPIRVRFLPSNPETNHPADWQMGVMPKFVPPFFAAFLAGMGVLFIWAIRREMRLLAEGKAAPARVTKLQNTKGGKSVSYEFQTSGGIRKGRTGSVSKPPAVGATVTILYDPENPRRNTLYPMQMVRVAR